ncbi:MAG: hypothetical protein K2W99_07385 [Chthoniobacterales bacterium]|nr:hypothetical protein [Chthoniobacterales bacterium]
MKKNALLFVTIMTFTVFLLAPAKGIDSDASAFVPTDSSPDASLFQSAKFPGKEETFWQKILPPVSSDFNKVNDQLTIALGKELITWDDLAVFFTSISVVGEKEDQNFLKKISEEVAPFISSQADGTYVAEKEEAHQPAQLAFSSNIFSKYALWREHHYQLYKTLLEEKKVGHFDVDLLEQQIKRLRIEEGVSLDSPTAAYHLATVQELADWESSHHQEIEAPMEGKTFALLAIDTENMKDCTTAQRIEKLLGSSADQKSSLNEGPSNGKRVDHFITTHPFTIAGVALSGIGVITLPFAPEIGVSLIALGITSMYIGIIGFGARKISEFL